MLLRLAVVIFSVAALAQPQERVTLAGIVVNARTGEPIARALVQATKLFDQEPSLSDFSPASGRQAPSAPQSFSVFTDTTGAFSFEGLLPGRYMVTPRKPHFSQIGPDAVSGMVELKISRSDLRLKLPPLGVITGKVVDQNGDPLRRVTILIITSEIADGERKTRVTRSVYTDDRGIYRAWNLNPGKYLVKAAGRSGGTAFYVGDRPPTYSSWESFAPVYFGGSRTTGAATPVVVDGGAEAQADFALAMEPAYRIRGALSNYTPDKTVNLELPSGDDDVSASRVSVNGATGQFEIQDVVAGAYTLRATQLNKARAEIPISVSSSDVSSMIVPLAPAVDVKVEVRAIVGAPTPHSDDDDADRPVGPAFCMVQLAEPLSRRSLMSRPDPQNPSSVVIAGVLPGKYRVHFQCPGGYAMSATSGSADLLANPEILILPDAPPSPIDVVVKAGGGTLHAKVEAVEGKSPAWVLLVPQFTASTGPVEMPVIPTNDFVADFMNLAPGDYVAYAFSGQDLEYRNPEVLRALSGGTPVKIEDGAEKEISIQRLMR